MSNKVANVIIIGGGPAGASTAILCRNFGLKVGLVEAVAFPRFAPGEALPCGIEAYFESLNIMDELHAKPMVTYEGTRMQWGPDDTFVANFGEDDSGIRRRGLQVPRHHLDTVLLEKAKSLGVAVLQPCVVKGMFAQKGRICGVVTNQGNFGADFIIDAAGSRHWMARKLRLELKYHSAPLYGSYGWATGEIPGGYDLPQIIADPKGWTWTSRVDEGLYQFTRCSFEKEDLPGSWLPDELKGLTPTGRVRGADLTWRRVVHPAGPGFFLCGDALCRTDPVVQQGVFKSMVCGFKVALMLDQIYNSGRSEEEARQEYCEWVESTYLSDLGLLRNYYERHPHAPDWIRNMEAPVVKRPEQPLVKL